MKVKKCRLDIVRSFFRKKIEYVTTIYKRIKIREPCQYIVIYYSKTLMEILLINQLRA